MLWRCDAVFNGPEGTATVMLHPHAVQPNENTGLVAPTGIPGGALALHLRDWLHHDFAPGKLFTLEVLPHAPV